MAIDGRGMCRQIGKNHNRVQNQVGGDHLILYSIMIYMFFLSFYVEKNYLTINRTQCMVKTTECTDNRRRQWRVK